MRGVRSSKRSKNDVASWRTSVNRSRESFAPRISSPRSKMEHPASRILYRLRWSVKPMRPLHPHRYLGFIRQAVLDAETRTIRPPLIPGPIFEPYLLLGPPTLNYEERGPQFSHGIPDDDYTIRLILLWGRHYASLPRGGRHFSFAHQRGVRRRVPPNR